MCGSIHNADLAAFGAAGNRYFSIVRTKQKISVCRLVQINLDLLPAGESKDDGGVSQWKGEGSASATLSDLDRKTFHHRRPLVCGYCTAFISLSWALEG